MRIQHRSLHWLLPAAAFVLATATGGEARALACDDQHVITQATQSFTDCAGQTVSVAFDNDGIVLSGAGPWPHQSWFSDLHVGVQFSDFSPDLSQSSFLNDDLDPWQESSGSAAGFEFIWFVAHDGTERVFQNDDYRWTATFLNISTPFSTANLEIAYTMDVPEPALGLVLVGGLLAAGIAGRPRA